MDASKGPEFYVWTKEKNDNGIGGFKETQKELFKINGYLDLLSGNEKLNNNSFMEESTHILLTDYRTDIKRKENWIMDSQGNRYDITLVDDPMNFHRFLEIYLKFIGDK